MKLFVTGDIHAGLDIEKISPKKFPENRLLTKDDLVIVAGDFGLPWDGGRRDQ